MTELFEEDRVKSRYAKAAVACAGGVLQILAAMLGGTAGQVCAVMFAAGTAYGVWAMPNATPPMS